MSVLLGLSEWVCDVQSCALLGSHSPFNFCAVIWSVSRTANDLLIRSKTETIRIYRFLHQNNSKKSIATMVWWCFTSNVILLILILSHSHSSCKPKEVRTSWGAWAKNHSSMKNRPNDGCGSKRSSTTYGITNGIKRPATLLGAPMAWKQEYISDLSWFRSTLHPRKILERSSQDVSI